MEYKQLGNTDIMIPEIGFGTWNYKGTHTPIHRAIELGANHIDTAEIYGTESAVGKAVVSSPHRSFIATKVWNNHLRYRDVIQSAMQSLKTLGIQQIDLYYIHLPNPSIAITDTMQAFEELVDRGVIRFIGVSNFSVAQLKEAQDALKKYPIVANQVLYNFQNRNIEKELIPYCDTNEITIVGYTPFGHNIVDIESGLGKSRLDNVLDQISQEISKTKSQIALNWCEIGRAHV